MIISKEKKPGGWDALSDLKYAKTTKSFEWFPISLALSNSFGSIMTASIFELKLFGRTSEILRRAVLSAHVLIVNH